MRVIIALVRFDRQDRIVFSCLCIRFDHVLVDVDYRFHIFGEVLRILGPPGWDRTTVSCSSGTRLDQLSYQRIYHLFTGAYEDGDVCVDRWQAHLDSNQEPTESKSGALPVELWTTRTALLTCRQVGFR
jgi:hypothetical protein